MRVAVEPERLLRSVEGYLGIRRPDACVDLGDVAEAATERQTRIAQVTSVRIGKT
jgi:hypothetical protein